MVGHGRVRATVTVKVGVTDMVTDMITVTGSVVSQP